MQKLEEIIRLAKQDPIALMRAEKVPWIKLNKSRNAVTAGVIPADASRVPVRVIHTDEEWMIASTVCRVLGFTIEKEHDHENKKGV
ncbi:MAG: hypothetical protein Q8S00_23740 [Deltaproteobacteria bacterium]|nr:hypothetical protein [Deltaproteobacteria bacterium]MDZ4343756.1 hypothetical protein [Candidatus Binatia bacterium]